MTPPGDSPPRDRHYTVELPASAERVPQLRRIIAAHLRHWKLAPQIPPVCDGVAELLTDAHRRLGPGARCVVELRWTGRILTASVAADGKVVWFTRRVETPHPAPAAGGTAPAA